MEMFVSKLISMTGMEHNTEIVAYGLYAIIDGLETIAVIMLLGAVTGKMNCYKYTGNQSYHKAGDLGTQILPLCTFKV